MRLIGPNFLLRAKSISYASLSAGVLKWFLNDHFINRVLFYIIVVIVIMSRIPCSQDLLGIYGFGTYFCLVG